MSIHENDLKKCTKCGTMNGPQEAVCRSCGASFEVDSSWISSRMDTPESEQNRTSTPYPGRTPTDTPPSDPGLKKPEVSLQQIGKFKLARFLGAGGMGEVHLARHDITGELVALKLIRKKLSANPDVRKRFLTEALVMKRIQNANVVRVHDIDEAGGHLFFSMEFLTGCSLKELIREYRKRKRFIPFPKILSLMEQICRGLEAAHKKGIVHRDLKPGNIVIVVDRHPETFDSSKKTEIVIAELFDSNLESPLPDESVKVLDFGLSKTLGLGDHTVVGQQLGTPYYMAPEQRDGLASMSDMRADVFSLGIMFYEMLTNTLPSGLSITLPSRVRADVHGDIDELVTTCSAADPSDRYESGSAVLSEIRTIQKSESVRREEKAKAEEAVRRQARETKEAESRWVKEIDDAKKRKEIESQQVEFRLRKAEENRCKLESEAKKRKQHLFVFGLVGVVIAIFLIYQIYQHSTEQTSRSGYSNYPTMKPTQQALVESTRTLKQMEELRTTVEPMQTPKPEPTIAVEQKDTTGFKDNISIKSNNQQGMGFDGTINSITIPDSKHLSVIGSSVTIEFWVKFNEVNAIPGQCIMLLRKWGPGGPSDDEYHLAIHDDKTFRIAFSCLSGQDWICSKTKAQTDQWYHIAGVLGNGNLSIYINGKKDNQKLSHLRLDRDTNEPLMIGIGGKDLGLGLNGSLNSIRISNSVRYQANFTPAETFTDDENTLGLWLLNEGKGYEIFDSSHHKNHGRVVLDQWK